MKTILLACLLGSLGVQMLHAQEDLSLDNSGPGISAMEESRQRKKVLDQQRRVRPIVTKNPVVYSGFLVDYSRAENKKKLLSLRQPASPRKDVENVFTDISNNRPKGFVLLALSY